MRSRVSSPRLLLVRNSSGRIVGEFEHPDSLQIGRYPSRISSSDMSLANPARRPERWSSKSTVKSDCTLHQLAPYIGRMKTSMARSLVLNWTKPKDVVVDPFCGCGVLALEAADQGREVVVGDWNPYAIVLTKAKLFAPKSQSAAEQRLQVTWEFAFEPELSQFTLEESYRDKIPDIRRSRRECNGTKAETILIYRKRGRSGRGHS